MLRSAKELLGYSISATDGDIGELYDLYFEDRSWRTRYLVVETAEGSTGRRVLISPFAVDKINSPAACINVVLSKRQVEESPGIDARKTISRQNEEDLARYYGWPAYWTIGEAGPEMPIAMAPAEGFRPEMAAGQARQMARDAEKPDLRSLREVERYRIHARDGDIGHVNDLIIQDRSWQIRYLAIDTGRWLPGRKVLLSVDWVHGVDWARQRVDVDATKQAIRDSPHYDPSEPVNRDYENKLYDYYGRPKYW